MNDTSKQIEVVLRSAFERLEQYHVEQCRTALAAMLCAGEPDCPTEREAKQLCVAALAELNTELNTKNTK